MYFRFLLLGFLSVLVISCQKDDLFSPFSNEAEANYKLSLSNYPSGIYAVADIDKSQEADILQNPDVSGIFVRVRWSTVEPFEDSYDWSFIDNEIDQAIKYGKKVSLAIIAGDHTPHWIKKGGFTFLQFKIIPHDGDGNPRWVSIPVPWETSFLKAYNDLMNDLRDHLLLKTSRYQAVSLIKVCGINQETAETRLPYQDSTYISGSDTASNAPSIWISKGYTPNKILAAWKTIADNCNKKFPDKPLGMAIIPDPNGFPSIDNNGVWQASNTCQTTQDLVTNAASFYGDQMIVQYNAITDTLPSIPIITLANQLGVKVAFQEQENEDNKTDISVAKTIQNAVSNGALFIELFNSTIKDHPTSVSLGSKLF